MHVLRVLGQVLVGAWMTVVFALLGSGSANARESKAAGGPVNPCACSPDGGPDRGKARTNNMNKKFEQRSAKSRTAVIKPKTIKKVARPAPKPKPETVPKPKPKAIRKPERPPARPRPEKREPPRDNKRDDDRDEKKQDVKKQDHNDNDRDKKQDAKKRDVKKEDHKKEDHKKQDHKKQDHKKQDHTSRGDDKKRDQDRADKRGEDRAEVRDDTGDDKRERDVARRDEDDQRPATRQTPERRNPPEVPAQRRQERPETPSPARTPTTRSVTRPATAPPAARRANNGARTLPANFSRRVNTPPPPPEVSAEETGANIPMAQYANGTSLAVIGDEYYLNGVRLPAQVGTGSPDGLAIDFDQWLGEWSGNIRWQRLEGRVDAAEILLQQYCADRPQACGPELAARLAPFRPEVSIRVEELGIGRLFNSLGRALGFGGRVPLVSEIAKGGAMARVGDFASEAFAFGHYAKHVKGVVIGKNGKPKLKMGGADMPEFTSFAEYRAAARAFMGGGKRDGVLEGIRPNGDLLRVDPATGYFGIRTSDGTIRTFFRPDGDPLAYFAKEIAG